MYLKFYIFAFIKVALLVAGPSYLAGFILGALKPEKVQKWAPRIGIGYYLFIEIVVFFEKGTPFFWGNIYFMYSLSPIVWLQYLIGICGGLLWAFYSVKFVKKGAKISGRLTGKGKPAENAVLPST